MPAVDKCVPRVQRVANPANPSGGQRPTDLKAVHENLLTNAAKYADAANASLSAWMVAETSLKTGRAEPIGNLESII